MADTMQPTVSELTDFSTELKQVLESCDPDVTRQGSFACNCLMPWLLVERGICFVQYFPSNLDRHRI